MKCRVLERLEDPILFAEAIAPTINALAGAGYRLGGRAREREPIPAAVRRLVFMRDHFTCKWCGSTLQPWHTKAVVDEEDEAPFQLDHILPHAAGGCDHAHNLRVLCRWCNERRSNYAIDHFARAIPVTVQCTPCRLGAINAYIDAVDWDAKVPDIDCTVRITAYCGSCRLGSWVNDEGLLL